MYRLVPLRMLRSTPRAAFHEIVPSDIPSIHGIDRVIHEPYATSPGPVDDGARTVRRPWYMHPAQDDNRLVLSGERFVWPAGIFHRIVTGQHGSISVNLSTRRRGFSLDDNFNVYDLETTTGRSVLLRDGKDDQPDLSYMHTDPALREILAQD